jgi:hypothetical protein
MVIYRLWYIRQGDNTQGPFPESLICRFIILGRIGEQDEVSQDGNYWQQAGDVPELIEGVRHLLSMSSRSKTPDPEWDEERAKAVLRWLDDRKSPDPRARQSPANANIGQEQRRGQDRRQTPETVEQHTYREWRGEFDAWLRQHRKRYGFVWAVIGGFVFIATLFVLFYQPVNPIKMGLEIHASNCEERARQGINWSGCVKDDTLLVGADLSGAELVGTSLQRTNLSHADLRRANLTQARLDGANLTGARLGEAVWTDGRICAADSVGQCR